MIRKNYGHEIQAKTQIRKLRFGFVRWLQMIFHEVIRDDVTIRAESLSYFTLFSILPLIAGIFLLLSFFSQWGPIQDEYQQHLGRLLQPIPEESRDSLLQFILKFKEDYLSRINEKSTSIGIFALGILIWIVAKVFMNMEDLMNRIWSVHENRSWFERLQNFVFTGVMFPLICLVSLSLPGIVAHFEGDHAKVWLAEVLPNLMVFFCLSFIFRYLPNVKVFWKSAFMGAAFSSILFWIANSGLKIYFHFGTGTGYGKAVVIPIVAFFIYVEWIVFMLGAEVSFLVQNQSMFTQEPLPDTTLGEAALLLETLKLMEARFKSGERPILAQDIVEIQKVPHASVMKVLEFLVERKLIVSLSGGSTRGVDFAYVLCRSLDGLDLGRLIKDYLNIECLNQSFDVTGLLVSLTNK